jgi:hypothetical protein
MPGIDTLIVTFLAVVLAVALAAVLPPWRRYVGTAAGLPFWDFARRRDLAPPHSQALCAQLRCEMCDAQRECRRLLAEGVDLPAAGCPNGELFPRTPR